MKCVDCDKEGAVTVFVEVFPCNHCEQEIHLEYNLCPNCGATWKSLDGNVADNVTLINEDIDAFFVNTKDQSDLVDSLISHLQELDVDSDSMSSYIHRCLKCNSIAYEAGEDLYRCPNCGFEWEIVRDE
jgi:uncharacterized Zn ribbon protein